MHKSALQLFALLVLSCTAQLAHSQNILPHLWLNSYQYADNTFPPNIQMTPQGNILIKFERVDLDLAAGKYGSALMMIQNNGTMIWDTVFANANVGLIDFLRSAHVDSAGNTWLAKDNASPSHHEQIQFDPQGNVLTNTIITMTRLFQYENDLTSNEGNLDFIPDAAANRLYFVVEPINFNGPVCSNDITELMYIDKTNGLVWSVDSIHFNDCADNVFAYLRDDNQDFYLLNSNENLPTGMNNQVVISKLINQQITPVIIIDSLNHWLLPKTIKKMERYLMCNYLADTNTTHNYARDVLKFYDMSTTPPTLVKTHYFDLKLTHFLSKENHYYVGEKHDITQTPSLNNNKVHKIAANGMLQWSTTLHNNTALKTLAVNNGYVYVVADRNDTTMLYELADATGAILQVYSLHQDFTTTGQYGASRIIIDEQDDLIYIAGGNFVGGTVTAKLGKYKVKSHTDVTNPLSAIQAWTAVPNPFTHQLRFVAGWANLQSQTVEIWDMQGRKLATGNTDGELELDFLPEGIYLAKIGGQTLKVVKGRE